MDAAIVVTYKYFCIYYGKKKEMIEKFGGSDIKCENCDYTFSLKKRHQCSFFIQLNLKSQIESVVEKYKQHLPSPDVDETIDDNITDVSCGNIYKKLKRKYKNLISLTSPCLAKI